MSTFSLASLERGVHRRQLVDAAVERLYLRRGGLSLDVQLRMYDAAVATATLCREAELERAKKGEFTRAKGERPLVSVSEGRLYSGRVLALDARKQEIMADARAQIMHALELANPQTDEQYAQAIEAALGDAATIEREESQSREEAVQAQAVVEAEIGPVVALLSKIENTEERRDLTLALEKRDEAAIAAIVSRQQPRWQRRWAEARGTAQQ